MLTDKFSIVYRSAWYVVFALLLMPHSLQAFEPARPYQLSADLAANSDVLGDFEFTPDGKNIVYRAMSDNGEIDLFKVPISGNNAENLTDAPASSGDVQSFSISGDGQKIVYLLNDAGEFSLWAYRSDFSLLLSGNGSQPALIPSRIIEYQISPDSSHVVYTAETDIPFFAARLFRGLLEPPFEIQPARISPDLTMGGTINPGFQFVPNANRVVYSGDVLTDDVIELFVSPTSAPGGATRVSRPMVSRGDLRDRFLVSPDSRYVVYLADARVDEVIELFSSTLLFPIQFNKLNPSNLASDEDIVEFKISPDSRRVVYRSDERNNNVFELFSVPISNNGGNLSVRISDTLTAGGEVIDYKISPNGARVVYRADQDVNNKLELYSGLISGLSVTPLTPNLAADGNVVDYDFSGFGARVVYLARQSGVQELFSVKVAGGDNTSLNPQLTLGGNVLSDFYVDPILDQVFYRADQEKSDVFELFSSKVEGPASMNVQLNEPLPQFLNQDVTDFKVSSNGKFLVYRADQNINQKFELFAVDLDDSGVCFPIKASNGNVSLICL